MNSLLDKSIKDIIIYFQEISSNNKDYFKVIKDSKKHHYIPQYFIKRFTDKDNLFYVYDKKRDKIKREKIGSNGIFYEKNRNNFQINEQKSISIFESFYSILDNKIPSFFKAIDQVNYNLTSEQLGQIIAIMNIFQFDLFLRSKNNDKLFNKISHKNELLYQNLPKEFREAEDFIKYAKITFIPFIFKSIIALKPSSTCNIYDTGNNTLCLSDNPFLILNKPSNIEDILTQPLIFPLSKNSLYCRNSERTKDYYEEEIILINALIIDQSSEYIICSSKESLEKSVIIYKHIKEQNIIDLLKKGLFINNN